MCRCYIGFVGALCCARTVGCVVRCFVPILEDYYVSFRLLAGFAILKAVPVLLFLTFFSVSANASGACGFVMTWMGCARRGMVVGWCLLARKSSALPTTSTSISNLERRDADVSKTMLTRRRSPSNIHPRRGDFLPSRNRNAIQPHPRKRLERCLPLLHQPGIFVGGRGLRRGHEEQPLVHHVSE